MKLMRNGLILWLLLLGFISYSQSNADYKEMIAKIDSISSAKNIENGMVKFHRVTSYGESTATNSYDLTRKQEFSFDGPFLVIGSSYFNLEKLLFFFVREDHIEFYFQGY